ncbi:hypothetical protein M2169_005806 [Streptomyces sp. MJP52]|nr:hypothetical protein [Streptomyces sp. MJP52]
MARALGVSPSTVAGWETGRDPAGDTREKYAYFLDRARTRLTGRPDPASDPDPHRAAPAALTGAAVPEDAAVEDAPMRDFRENPAASAPEAASAAVPAVPGDDDVELLPAPQPCVLCAAATWYRMAGFPQHLSPDACAGAASSPAVGPSASPVSAPREASTPLRTPAPTAAPSPTPVAGTGRPVAARRDSASTTGAGSAAHLITAAVDKALADHHGDIDAAAAALVKRAIPDAMTLLDTVRKGGRYDVIAHPWIPDILRKPTAHGADQVWEARPKWTRPHLPTGRHHVTALDINGAYLSALKTHLPIGQLEHSTGPHHDRRRSGVHLITPPRWEHDDVLPNPLGNREEPGPVWVTEPTLRLLLRLSGPRHGLCEPPVIHESFTSGATENLLEKFRVLLKDARDRAIAAGDDLTLDYVKAMYSKFVSTMGESNYNRQLYRPDWMHIIRSQAFANLWTKAYKAHEQGLTLVRVMGTDELHLTGDWRTVCTEGRALTEVKIKDTYTLDGTPG